jgi:biopolymer transport protein ExbB
VAIMIERALFYKARSVDAEALGSQLTTGLRSKNLEPVARILRGSQALECVVLSAGLSEINRGINAVSEAMLSAKARERLRWEAYLSILGTLGANTPFIGLLGTVLGIIKASKDLAASGGSQNQSASAAVMTGVFEALVATAVGLFVAIPAVMAYNYFQRRVKARVGQTDSLAHLLLSLMKSDQPAAAPSRKPEPARSAATAPGMAPPVSAPSMAASSAAPPMPPSDLAPPMPPPEPSPFAPPRVQQVP